MINNKQDGAIIKKNEAFYFVDLATKKKFEVFLNFLCKLYPKLFTQNKREIKPLALNIRFLLRDAFKELDTFKAFWKENSYEFLRWYTHNRFYYLAMIKNMYRYDLQGNASSKITFEHKNYSLKLLKVNLEHLKKNEVTSLKYAKTIKYDEAIIAKFERAVNKYKRKLSHD